MSDDIRAGDVVVCVDDSPPREGYFIRRGWTVFPFRLGKLYRVRAIAPCETRALGLLFAGLVIGYYDRSGTEIVAHPRRFRKLRRADEPFTREVRACRPIKNTVEA